MRRIRLIHWKPAEAQERVETLQRLGYAVEFETFNPAAAREVLGLPDGVEPVAFTPLGYPADQPGPKERKALAELVRYEGW